MGDLENILSSAVRVVNQNKKILSKGDISECGRGWIEKVHGSVHYSQKEVELWGIKDLYYFFMDEYEAELHDVFHVALATGCERLKFLQDEISDFLGYRASISIVRDYIAWFVQNRAKRLVIKYNCFKMKFLIFRFSIVDFFDQYEGDFEIIAKETGANKNLNDAKIFDSSTISAVFASSPSQMVLRYGLILSVIWLIQKQGMSERRAISFVASEAVKLIEKGHYDKFIKATEQHNPYPIWCRFSTNNLKREISVEIGESFDPDIRFSPASDRFSFLKE